MSMRRHCEVTLRIPFAKQAGNISRIFVSGRGKRLCPQVTFSSKNAGRA